MTGLDLESFLRLLRADVGAWSSLGVIVILLALLAWTSWGSKRALRKCLVLSVLAHVGLLLYGGATPAIRAFLLGRDPSEASRETKREHVKVAVAPVPERGRLESLGRDGIAGRSSVLDMPKDPPGLPDSLKPAELRPQSAPEPPLSEPPSPSREALAVDTTSPDVQVAPPSRADREVPPPPADEAPVVSALPGDPAEVAQPVSRRAAKPSPVLPILTESSRIRPESAPSSRGATADVPRSNVPLPTFAGLSAPETATPSASAGLIRPERLAPGVTGNVASPIGDASQPLSISRPRALPTPRESLPEANVRQALRSEPAQRSPETRSPIVASPPLELARATPNGLPSLPDIRGAAGISRPLTDVPAVYRSRLDPNRAALARRAGATPESEQAVERALDWLRRHQDADGRWDGGTARYKDGSAAEGDDDYTVHCPPGETCFGECYYWEADTALTGLALLAYLGAGYTHTDGKYADTVSKGLEFLRLAQRPDGDLRGRSQAVGMYCHAMAALALCEAYALTGDPKLREPVERAVRFLTRSRARDSQAWRYAPGAPIGDTSILGWVVMVIKSAQEVGIPIPAEIRDGVRVWLTRVSAGASRGLAMYQPGQKVTPTMTAEAWVCRQFLGVGGPGAASTEAAELLLAKGPDREPYNLYYWYYGTLAMYQHGGSNWTRWNALVRDRIIAKQRNSGHSAGSWDPDASQYGTHGGRIYCTALATLSLEVYYRYLRLYEAPTSTLPSASSRDASTRRSNLEPVDLAAPRNPLGDR